MADTPTDVHPLTKKFLGKELYLVVARPVRSPEIEKKLADPCGQKIKTAGKTRGYPIPA
jgi:hypothetical protein